MTYLSSEDEMGLKLICFEFFTLCISFVTSLGSRALIYLPITTLAKPTTATGAKLSPQCFSTYEPSLGHALLVSAGAMVTYLWLTTLRLNMQE